MVFSPLISGTVPHYNKFSSRGGQSIDRLLQHHWAGIGGGDARLLDPNELASATYIIYSDGRIMGQVPEEYRPWTSGGSIDGSSVTIEVQNVSGQINGDDNDPMSWQVSGIALNSIQRLLADVASRNGWGSVNENNYQGHRQYYQTACPGGFLWARMDAIRSGANDLFNGVVSPASNVVVTPTYTANEKFFIDLNIPLP